MTVAHKSIQILAALVFTLFSTMMFAQHDDHGVEAKKQDTHVTTGNPVDTQEEINAFSSMIGTLIILRVGAVGDSISKLSKALGEQQFERLNPSFDTSGKASFSWQRLSLPIVAEAELLNLAQANKKNGVTGFVSIAGTNIVAKLIWPLTILPKTKFNNEPADWVSDSNSTITKKEKNLLDKNNNKLKNTKINLSELDNAFAVCEQDGDVNA